MNTVDVGAGRALSAYREFRFGWKVLLAAAVGVCAGVTGANVYSLGLFLTPLTDEFGWTRTQVSASKTFITLGFVVTAPFVGHLADNIGVRKIGMFSLVLLSLAMLGMTQITSSINFYYASLFALAIAGCATTPLVWTRGVATWFHEKRGLALGVTLAGSGIAGIFTPPLLGGLIDGYGWRAGYIAMAVLALLAIIPAYFFFFENDSKTDAATVGHIVVPKSGMDVRDALTSRQYWQISFGFMLIGGVVSSLVVHLVPLLSDSGFPRDLALKTAGLMGVAVVIGRISTGYLVDRFHPPYVAGIVLSIPAIGCAILAGDQPAFGMIVFAAITFGFAAGSEVDLIPYLTARYFGLKAYGRIYGWLFVFFYFGVGSGPLFLGWMYDQYGSYSNALYIAIPALLTGAVAVTLLGKPPQFK